MTYATEVAADAPRIWYRCEETSGTTVADSSGNGFNGTTTASVGWPSYLDSLPTNKFHYAGSSTTNSTSSTFGTDTSFTIEAIFSTTTLSGNQTIAARRNSTSTSSWLLRLESTGVLKLYVWSSAASNTSYIISSSIAVNTTYHVAASFASGTNIVRGYLNGVETVAGFASGPIFYPATPQVLRIGNTSLTSEGFNGIIDEVAYYNTVIAESRLAAHSALAQPGGDMQVRLTNSIEQVALRDVVAQARITAGMIQVAVRTPTPEPDAIVAAEIIQVALQIQRGTVLTQPYPEDRADFLDGKERRYPFLLYKQFEA